MQAAGGQRLGKLQPIRPLATLDLGELGRDRPVAAVEIGQYRLALGFKAEA